MNWPWTIWFLAWVGLAIIGFAILEARAFRHPERQNTLSRTVFLLGQNWPLSIFILGHVLGGLEFALAVHFYWHWCPSIMPAGVGG